jgi:hypothetical protein
MAVTVLFAVYGGLRGGDPLQEEAIDVTQAVQGLINQPGFPGTILINNQNMGEDPAVGVVKHFGALIEVDGASQAFACQENQEIAILA